MLQTLVLCDCPGTDDTRGALVDMKQKHKVRLAASGAGIKALMVVQYSAFLPDECASTFMSVVQYTVALLAGLDTFHAAVFLVVTKVHKWAIRIVFRKKNIYTFFKKIVWETWFFLFGFFFTKGLGTFEEKLALCSCIFHFFLILKVFHIFRFVS